MPLNSVLVNVVSTLILRSVCLVGMIMYMRPSLQPVMLIISGANGTSQSLAHYLISCDVLGPSTNMLYAIAVNRKNKFRLILWLSLCLNRTSVLFGAKSPKQSLHLCPTLLYSRPGHCIFLLWRYSSFIIVLYFCIYVPAFEADASDGSNEDDNSNDADCTDNDDYQQNVFIDR